MIKRILAMLVFPCLAACGDEQPGITGKDSMPSDTIVTTVAPEAVYPMTKIENDTLIIFDFGPNDTTGTANVTASYAGHGKHITCLLKVQGQRKLYAELDPESDKANIRFNQVIMPNGNADGPFGKMLTYKLAKKGEYKIIVGESLMAGEDWKGKVDIKMTLEK